MTTSSHLLLLLGSVTESSVFGQRRDGAKRLTAALTTDLQSAVCVHALVAAQVGKLRVRLETHFALERLLMELFFH